MDVIPDHQIYRQYAYLSIRGHGPSSVITKHLGLDPDKEWSEGDPWKDKEPHKKRKFMFWQLDSGLTETEDLNDHVRSLMQKLKSKRTKIQTLMGNYDVKVVCVSYSLQNFSFELDFELQRELTAFGLRIWYDAYIDGDTHSHVQDLREQLRDKG